MKNFTKYLIVPLLLILFSISNGFSASNNSSTNGTGDWTAISWTGDGQPPLPVGSKWTINISSGDVVTINGNFQTSANIILNVYGTLIITNDFIIGGSIDINVYGSMTVQGSFTSSSQSDIVIDGTGSVEINGDMALNAQANLIIGPDSGDNDALLTVDGTLSTTSGGSSIQGYGGISYGALGGSFDESDIPGTMTVVVDTTDYIWDGEVSTDWTVAANWNPDRDVPSVDDNLTFSSGGIISVTNIPASETFNSLTIEGASDVVFTGSNSGLTINDQIQITSGSLSFADVDLEAVTVSVSSGQSLTVGNSSVLTISSDNANALTVDGTLLVKDNSSNASGQLYVEGGISSSGTCTFERYLTTAAHHYVSSPVDAADNALGLGVAPKVKNYWNETAGEWQGISTDLSVGIGYDYYFTQNVTAEFSGSSFNMADTYNAIPIDNGAGGGFNLIGNPYPFAINAEEVLNMNTQDLGGANSITGTIAIWDEGSDNTTYDESFYILVTGAGSVAGKYKTFNGYIAPGQAFFVEAAAASTGTFTINKSMAEVSQTPVFFKSAKKESEIQRLKLFVDNGTNLYSEILVAFKEGTSMDKDPAYDAGNAETGKLSLYSFIQEDKYAIQAQPVLKSNENRIVNLGINVKRKGNVEFNIKEKLNLGENVKVFLEDMYNDTIIEMGKAQGYFVNLEKKRYDKRFRLIFRNDNMPEAAISQYKSLNTQEAIENEVNSVPDVVQDITFTTNINTIENGVHIYYHKKTMHIKTDKIIENANIEIYNLLGAKIASFEYLSTQQTYALPNVKEGIYIVSIGQQNKSIKAVKLFFE